VPSTAIAAYGAIGFVITDLAVQKFAVRSERSKPFWHISTFSTKNSTSGRRRYASACALDRSEKILTEAPALVVSEAVRLRAAQRAQASRHSIGTGTLKKRESSVLGEAQ
jgi:hypothetical protein